MLLLFVACRVPLPGPGPVLLVLPAADAVLDNGQVVFCWDSIAGAASYQLQVDDRTSFISPVLDSAGIANTDARTFLADGDYYWRVRARSRDSILGDWSAVRAFRVVSYRIAGRLRTRGYPQNVQVIDNLAYIADGQAGLSIYDVSNPAEMRLAGKVMDTANSCWGVAVSGRYAYLAYGRKQLQIVDITRLDSLKLLGSIGYTTGYAYDIAALDTNYVIVANHGKSSLFDVRNPDFPILLYEPKGMSRGIALRDTTAYLACEQQGLLIIRYSLGREPVTLAELQTLGNARATALSENHCLIADGREGLTIIDISDPAAPVIVGNCRIPGGYANRVAVKGKTAFIAAGSAGLAVIDFADPAAPALRSIVKTPYSKAVTIADDGRIFATDRDWGLLAIKKAAE